MSDNAFDLTWSAILFDLKGQKLDMLKLYKIYNESIWTESRRFPYVNVLLGWIVVLSISRSEIVFSDLPATEVIDKSFILNIQENLFIIGSLLAIDYSIKKENNPIKFSSKKTDLIEKEIDKISSTLPEMTNFIIPGGHITVSICHISRSICRRAERICVKFSKDYEINQDIIIYINRLSDYLFTLSRKISLDTNTKETKWINK